MKVCRWGGEKSGISPKHPTFRDQQAEEGPKQESGSSTREAQGDHEVQLPRTQERKSLGEGNIETVSKISQLRAQALGFSCREPSRAAERATVRGRSGDVPGTRPAFEPDSRKMLIPGNFRAISLPEHKSPGLGQTSGIQPSQGREND